MYNYHFENNKYRNKCVQPRVYPMKFFGNDYGHSLEKIVETGYVKDLKSLKPLFNQYNSQVKPKEEFTNYDGNKSTLEYISQNESSFPFKYYRNNYGHSLEKISIKKDKHFNKEKEEKKEEFKMLKNKRTRSGPYKYNTNKFGHSLESITNVGGYYGGHSCGGGAGLAFSN